MFILDPGQDWADCTKTLNSECLQFSLKWSIMLTPGRCNDNNNNHFMILIFLPGQVLQLQL